MTQVLITPQKATGSKPVIGYRNLFRETGGTVSVSSEAAGFPKEDAYDEIGSDFWQPSATGVNWLEVDFGTTNKTADYLAVCRHTLGTDSAQVVAQYWDGAAWVDAFTPFTVSDDEALLVLFAEKTATRWRFWYDSAGTPKVGAVNIGQRLTLERGIFVGHAPETLNRTNRVSGGRTEGGAWLPSTVVRQAVESEISVSNLSASYVFASLEPFMRHADDRRPFFWAWSPTKYPTHVVWARTTGDARAQPSQVGGPQERGWWEFNVGIRGVIK